MSVFDLLLLASALAFAVFAPRLRGGLRLILAGALLTGLALQLAFGGFYWQFVPTYLLVAVTLATAWWKPRPAGRLRRWTGRIALAVGLLLAIGPWCVALPVPRLPAPTGPYRVGSEIFRWVDAARPETATADPADRRNVIVQAWYPADPGAVGPHLPYIDGLGRLPAMVSVMPSFIMRAYGGIDTHAVAGAPVSPARPTWPVVLFSPGYGAPRAGYSGLVADLASRGYVVLAVDHPYEVGVTQLADGTLATPRNDFPVEETGQHAYMVREQDLRAADLRFVLDQIGRPGVLGPQLSGRLDQARIAAAGHSFGGAASVLAAQTDPRLKAAVNIDGAFYGAIPDQRLDRPFMLIESDFAQTPHGDLYLHGVNGLFSHLAAPGRRVQFKGANHYSFTDAPMYLAPPARWAAARVIGGERGPEATQRQTVDLLDAFLRQSGL